MEPKRKHKALPPLARLYKILKIDPSSPTGLRWIARMRNNSIWPGMIAGGRYKQHGEDYWAWRVGIGMGMFVASRIIWFMAYGKDPYPMEVDHIDRNPLNNKLENLRLAEPSQNCRNQAKRISNKTGYKGVSFDQTRNAFRAQIMVNYKKYNLGDHPTPEEAHAAYCRAARELHGEFARTE